MKRTGRKDLNEEYKRLKRQIQRELRQQYWQYCSTLIVEDESDKPKPSKKLFSFVKSRKTEINGIAPLKESGKLITDNKLKAELLNRQFKSAFSTREDFTEVEFNQICPMPPRNPQQPLLEHITVSTSGIEKSSSVMLIRTLILFFRFYRFYRFFRFLGSGSLGQWDMSVGQ
ncbi:hypothetical protein ACOMHN_033799 [Nucella lapillus]